MANPMIRIIDGDTVIDREMTADEYVDYKKVNEAAAKIVVADEAAQAAQAAAKLSAQNKLAALGLTPDEIAAL